METRKVTKYGKKILIKIDDSGKYFPDGSLTSKKNFYYCSSLLFLLLPLAFFFLSFYIGVLKSILGYLFLFFVIIIINNSFFYFFRRPTPDYVIVVRGTKKVGFEDILDHEMFHMEIIEKGRGNKELMMFMHNKLDEMTPKAFKNDRKRNK